MEKWKKCWSDFKNNTKKKLRKIQRKEATAELTDLERRVLKLVSKNAEERTTEYDDDSVNQIDEIGSETCQTTSTSQPHHFCAEDNVSSTPHAKTHQRRSSASSNGSTSSSYKSPPIKRKKRFHDSMKDMTKRYLEFEREREKMAHEREMARLKQNDQLFTIFGRIVNVLDTLAPSVQTYLDRSCKE